MPSRQPASPFGLAQGKLTTLLFALRWETHAAAGDGLRSDCGDHEETA